MKKIFISLLLALMSVVGAWAQDYLSMKAVGGSVSIGMAKAGDPADYDLQYSFDKTDWTTVALTATNSNIVEIGAGQTCYFRHGTEAIIGRISSNGNYWTFTMTGTGTIEAGGNIMSLLDATVQKNNIGSTYAFVNLFKGCAKLTKAPKLPATSISERCYMGMFEETGIVEAPELPAASVIKGSYQNMFKNCQNLEKAPILMATRVNWAGYYEMFYGCKKITEITLGNIEVIENGNVFQRWLDGTAYGTEGTLITTDAMVGRVSLPSDWQYKQKRDYIAEVLAAAEGIDASNKAIVDNYINQIKAAGSNSEAIALRDAALKAIRKIYIAENEPTAVSFTFEGDGMPIETEHRLEGMKMTFSEGGEKMTVMVNGAEVTYDLDNVGELVHFRGTPSVSLHANQDPDENTPSFYTTFYSGLEAYTLPEGVKAYTAEVSGETIVLTRIEGYSTSSGQVILPRGEAVLLYSNELQDGNFTMEIADPTAASRSTTNQFMGVDVATAQSAANYYMLSYGQNKLAFYKMNSGMALSANKAFIMQSSATPAKAMSMVFEDEVTGIRQIDNGELRIENSVIYNLNGVRLNKLQKGINIVNGKKVIIK